MANKNGGLINISVKVGKTTIKEVERELIEITMAHYAGHQGHTAKALGITYKTLYNKLRRYAEGASA